MENNALRDRIFADNEHEEIPDSFVCCVCLDLLYKPIVLSCGHICCFWCVYNSMNCLRESQCPVCRHQYYHFPTVCQMLHFLLLKIYSVPYKRREEQTLEEEKKSGFYSPQFDPETCESQAKFGHSGIPFSSSIVNLKSNSCNVGTSECMEQSGSTTHERDEGTVYSNGEPDIVGTPAKRKKLPQEDISLQQKLSVADVTCTMCKQLLFHPVVLNCGHVYCQTCVVNTDDDMLRCQVCQSPHPSRFPKVCLELDHFLEEQFPEEYRQRRDAIELKQIKVKLETPSCSLDKGNKASQSLAEVFESHGTLSLLLLYGSNFNYPCSDFTPSRIESSFCCYHVPIKIFPSNSSIASHSQPPTNFLSDPFPKSEKSFVFFPQISGFPFTGHSKNQNPICEFHRDLGTIKRAMLGAVQLGLLAACVVLFVPMGMAGWHLSRNKVLFFSGALFITLAVGVHLTPYFPSVSDFVTSVSSSSVNVVVDDRDSCVSLLHEIVWEVRPRVFDFDPMNNNSVNYEKSWSWKRSGSVESCEFQRLNRHDVSVLLNGSWVVVAGDSQARIFALSLLSLVLDSEGMESVKGSLFKRHSDYHTEVDEMGMMLDFMWAPYVTNLTSLVAGFKRNRVYPDLLVMGSGLWHMLHITNASDYGVSLGVLRSSVTSLLPVSSEFGNDESVAVRSPHLFWLGMPTLVNSMLNTAEKREKMTDLVRGEYEREVKRSGMLRQFEGPLHLLDIGSLSWNCGIRCTDDGMHYDGVVYEAGVHVMLNALLIESHQKI